MPEWITLGGCVFVVGFIAVGTSLLLMIKVLYQYERGVVFTLGKYSGTRKPGITLLFPVVQTMRKVDMRIKTADIPRQEVMTKDNIPMLVNAVVYFKVISPEDVIIKIQDHVYAIRQYTQAALRDVIGNSEMDSVLTEREQIAESIKEIVDTETNGWGVDVESIKIQEASHGKAGRGGAGAPRDDHCLAWGTCRLEESEPGGGKPGAEQGGAAPAHAADDPRHRRRPFGEDHTLRALRPGPRARLPRRGTDGLSGHYARR